MLQLRIDRERACIGAEDMFWSPQDKEKYIKTIDNKIARIDGINEFVVEIKNRLKTSHRKKNNVIYDLLCR